MASNSKVVGNYTLVNKLGRGTFADVYYAVHHKTSVAFALKVISKDKVMDPKNPKLQENLDTEIAIMRDFHHDNVVKLYEYFHSSRFIYLVLELCPGGDLSSFIKKSALGRLEERVTLNFLHQLANGLRFLLDKNIIHRDLKPANILLSEATENAVLKLADFGFARQLAESSMAQTPCGTPLYMAPEIFEMHDYDGKADIWSVGCIFYEMLTGGPPFRGMTPKDLLMNIKTKPLAIPPELKVSKESILVLGKLLSINPKKRATLEQLQQACLFVMNAQGFLPNTATISPTKSTNETPTETPVSTATMLSTSPSIESAPIKEQSGTLVNPNGTTQSNYDKPVDRSSNSFSSSNQMSSSKPTSSFTTAPQRLGANPSSATSTFLTNNAHTTVKLASPGTSSMHLKSPTNLQKSEEFSSSHKRRTSVDGAFFGNINPISTTFKNQQQQQQQSGSYNPQNGLSMPVEIATLKQQSESYTPPTGLSMPVDMTTLSRQRSSSADQINDKKTKSPGRNRINTSQGSFGSNDDFVLVDSVDNISKLPTEETNQSLLTQGITSTASIDIDTEIKKFTDNSILFQSIYFISDKFAASGLHLNKLSGISQLPQESKDSLCWDCFMIAVILYLSLLQSTRSTLDAILVQGTTAMNRQQFSFAMDTYKIYENLVERVSQCFKHLRGLPFSFSNLTITHDVTSLQSVIYQYSLKLANLGWVANLLGNNDKAINYYEEASKLLTQMIPLMDDYEDKTSCKHYLQSIEKHLLQAKDFKRSLA